MHSPKLLFLGIAEYFQHMTDTTVSLVGGIFTVLFLLIGAAAWLAEYQTWYWFVASLISFCVATFVVWYKDRPQLYVTVKKLYGLSDPGWEDLSTLYLTFVLHCRNTDNRVNALDSFHLWIHLDNHWKECLLSKDAHFTVTLPALSKGGDEREDRIIKAHSDLPNSFIQGQFVERPLTFILDTNELFPDKTSLNEAPYKLQFCDFYNRIYTFKGIAPLKG
jgi:hypothetical protein